MWTSPQSLAAGRRTSGRAVIEVRHASKCEGTRGPLQRGQNYWGDAIVVWGLGANTRDSIGGACTGLVGVLSACRQAAAAGLDDFC
jgi:hypothetical protein